MNIPVIPGYVRCQHCTDKLMASADGQLRTSHVSSAIRAGATTCEGMPRVAHKLMPEVPRA